MRPANTVEAVQERLARLPERRAGAETLQIGPRTTIAATGAPKEPPQQANAVEGDSGRFRFLTDTEIAEMPPPESQIGDKIFRGTLAVLVGPPAAGKSLMALAWAASVCTGIPALGDAVQRGGVVYVAAEGSAGLRARLRAWKTANHVTGPIDRHFLIEPVNLMEEHEVQAFMHALATLPEPPALVVIDTLARCLIGGDENSAKDMGKAVAAMDRIRHATGATVLVIHHTRVDGDRERGSTALRGACDTMMFLVAEGSALAIGCEKQKDAAPFEPAQLQLTPLAESVVVTARSNVAVTGEGLTKVQAETLALLQTHFDEEGATATQWEKVSTAKPRTFYHCRTELVRRGYVVKPEKTRGGLYTLSGKGRAWVTANCKVTANSLQCSNPKLLPASGPLIEGPQQCSNGPQENCELTLNEEESTSSFAKDVVEPPHSSGATEDREDEPETEALEL